MRACLITNPHAGRGPIDLAPVLAVLRAHGWEVTVRATLIAGMATDLAREAAREGYNIVVGCGGDGTLSEIVGGLVGTATAVGSIPGGTVNLWAREVGIASRLDVAAQQLVESVPRRADVGRVTIAPAQGAAPQTRYFLFVAGLGVDGAIMARVSRPLKNRVGRLAVGLAAVRAFPALRPVPVRARIGATAWAGRAWLVVVGNTRLYGGFTRLTPQAVLDDGLLDVCILAHAGLPALARQAVTLLRARHPDWRTARSYRDAQVTIRTPRPLVLQLDGDTVKPEGAAGVTTYTFGGVAGGVTLLVPATYRGDLFQRPPGVLAEAPAILPGEAASAGPPAAPPGEKQILRVVAVDGAGITATRLRDGTEFRLSVGPETELTDAVSRMLAAPAFLAAVAPGALLWAEGTKGSPPATITPRKIRLLGGPGVRT